MALTTIVGACNIDVLLVDVTVAESGAFLEFLELLVVTLRVLLFNCKPYIILVACNTLKDLGFALAMFLKLAIDVDIPSGDATFSILVNSLTIILSSGCMSH
ncbi:hypothetical protein C8R47DRAFT_1081390 [Mycena vitilis]|nr:hypothetical protein C8R47DRAFT_1081390 [Mycena vitilis]